MMMSAQLLTWRLHSAECIRLDVVRWRWICAEAASSIQILHSGSSVSMITIKMGRSTSENPDQSVNQSMVNPTQLT